MKPKQNITIPFDTRMLSEKQGVYIVGGSTRDLLLERRPVDYDIAVSQNPELFAAQLAQAHRGRLVPMGRAGQRVFRVITEKLVFDVSSLNGRHIFDDLACRDFTINAMAIDLAGGKLIDCLNGLQDLQQKRIKMVSPDVFRNDPVRLLRAYRMAGSFGFDIEPETARMIQQDGHRIAQCAGERLRSEFFKILSFPDSSVHIRQMAENGLLTSLFPEFEPLKGCRQNNHHDHDVYHHTLAAYAYLENQFEDRGLTNPIARFLVKHHLQDIPLLKFAILFHDMGKPESRTICPATGIHFYGHERKGVVLFEKIARRIRLSAREEAFISHIIRHHMRPHHLFTAHQKGRLSARSIMRFFMACAPQIPHLLGHALADAAGKSSTRHAPSEVFENFIKNLMERYRDDYRPKRATPPVITGHDLIKTFQLRPSPLFSKILKEVEVARLTRPDMDKAAALALVSELIGGRTKPDA